MAPTHGHVVVDAGGPDRLVVRVGDDRGGAGGSVRAVVARARPECGERQSDRSQSGGANPWQKAWRRMKPLGYDVEYDEPLQAK